MYTVTPMPIVEKIGLSILFGMVPILACFIAGWWISIPLVPESWVPFFALGGLLSGVVVDVIFLKGWIRQAYSIRPWVWKSIYGFYAVGMFGFFMGVPVFHVLLGIPAGLVVGGWLAHTGADSAAMKKISQRSATFTTSVMGLICIASAVIALTNRSTASEVQHMLGLGFTITPLMLLGIILIGGTTLLVIQWWLTVLSVKWTYRYFFANTVLPHR
ncbi:MAG: hypothetical protein GX455_05045 [Phycisphaerae bacterium]|nr:hypothetical protein [Phycisphaerae bacterium]